MICLCRKLSALRRTDSSFAFSFLSQYKCWDWQKDLQHWFSCFALQNITFNCGKLSVACSKHNKSSCLQLGTVRHRTRTALEQWGTLQACSTTLLASSKLRKTAGRPQSATPSALLLAQTTLWSYSVQFSGSQSLLWWLFTMGIQPIHMRRWRLSTLKQFPMTIPPTQCGIKLCRKKQLKFGLYKTDTNFLSSIT